MKRNVVSTIANLVYELHYGLPKNLRLRILENKEMSGNSQDWLGT